jgi:hypothetical protein
MAKHPWKLVGPWYREDSVGGAANIRNSAPIFQKYADADFAQKIIAEPQNSLMFNSEDFVSRITLDPDQVIGVQERAASTSPLKLFLDLHSRFYILVCELHCDAPGFPNVDRKQVCEAGFVVRRRVPIVTPGLEATVSGLLRERNQLRSDVLKAESNAITQQASVSPAPGNNSLVGLVKSKSAELVSTFQSASLDTLNEKLSANIEQLNNYAQSGDVSLSLQAWFPSDLKGVGNWLETEETPETVTEQILPLYPLISDPQNPDHSARGKTLWFGVIPTSSGDTDTKGNPKFDDSDLYEVRCFVKRHKSQFPVQKNAQDCCGEIVWSKPTEGYQLASPYDLDGTSHRPVNIKLPDLDALKAQTDLGPPGRGANARIIAPPNSSLNFATDEMEMPEAGDPLTRSGQQICFFAFFLFFIVAMFLFRLFLPILLFLFQLWFLLKLKLCIPPSIEIDAGLVADLDFEGSFGVDFDVSIEAHVELMVEFSADLAVQMSLFGPDLEAQFNTPGFSLTVNQGKDNEKTYTTAQALCDDVSLMIANGINVSDSMRNEMVNGGDGLKATSSLNELASIYITMKTEFEDIKNPQLAGSLPSPEKGLVYFDVVERTKVAA